MPHKCDFSATEVAVCDGTDVTLHRSMSLDIFKR